MSSSKETIILGAGLSGLIAAIILARNGRNVKVIEGAEQIGGDMAYHPSLHGTPINVNKIVSWTGLDMSRMITRSNDVKMFIGSEVFSQKPIYIVERGHRPQSIDYYLFEEAKKLGVNFEFGRYVKDMKVLPKGSIIATGFNPFMYKEFDLPYRGGEGYFLLEENNDPALEGNVYGWIGPYSNDYAYACVLNGLKYIAVFSRFGLTENSLTGFHKHLKDSVGWEFDNWKHLKNIPVSWNSKKPALWIDDYIVTGTVGGFIDPMAGFGIHGAMVSGVVAAWAVIDPDKAKKELKKLNKHHTASYLSFEATKHLPVRDKLYATVFVMPELFRPLISFMGKGVPGIDQNWIYDIIKGHCKGKNISERFRDIAKIARA